MGNPIRNDPSIFALTTAVIVCIVLHYESGESPKVPTVLPDRDRRHVQLCPPVNPPVTLRWTGRVRPHSPLWVASIAESYVSLNVHSSIVNVVKAPQSSEGGEVSVVEYSQCMSQD